MNKMPIIFFNKPTLSWRHKDTLLLTACCWLFIMLVSLTTTPSAGYELTGTITSTSSTFCATRSYVDNMTTLEVPVGSNLNITCHIDSSSFTANIWFEICHENVQAYETIKSPNRNIQVLDVKTVNLMLKNLTEQRSIYKCRHGEEIISDTQIIVGSAPKKIKDLFCYNNNGVQLVCEFMKPLPSLSPYALDTKYVLNYTADHYKHWGTYKNVTSVKCVEEQNDSSNGKVICHADGQVLTAFHNYNFTLIASNKFGSTAADFIFNIYENAISSKLNIFLTPSAHAVNINIDPIGNFILDNNYYIDEMIILQYEIGVQLLNTKWEYNLLNLTALTRTFTKPNLYANQYYNISVRMRVLQEYILWNEPYISTLKTSAEKPTMPPTTFVGGFYANELKSQVQLFWKHIPNILQNGTDFTYIITQITKDELILSSTTNESSILLKWDNHNIIDYYIQSSNEMGVSVSQNHIRVYPQSKKLHNPRNVAVVYANNTYTIYWQAPIQRHVTNYTVLWCTARVASNNQCKGVAHAEYVAAKHTNFTIPAEDIALNIAISANFVNYSSGLQWSSCSADEDTDLLKIEPEIYELQSTQLKLRWSAGSVCNIIIKGYNLTYCELKTHKPSWEYCQSVNILNECQCEFISYTISALKPNTQYSIVIYMYSDKKIGPLSNYLRGLTAEGAPSEPQNLRYIEGSISSTSVNLTWEAPLEENGNIKKYTIWYGLRNQSKEYVQIRANGERILSYQLEKLKSYTEYDIYVRASTVSDSPISNAIRLQTLIGVPSAPFNVNLNEKVLTWEAPHVPSGRVDFYLVQLIIMRQGKDKDTTAYVEPVFGRNFKVRDEECLDSQITFKWQVRAVNAAAAHEFDNQTYSQIDMKKHLAYSSNENNINSNTINCYGGEVINLEHKKLPLTLKPLQYFCSPWQDARPFISCSLPSVKQILLPILMLLVLIVAVMLFSLWARKKYNRMKNIGAVLPEGLCDIKPRVTNEFSVEKKSDFERNIDALMITTTSRTVSQQQLSVALDNTDSYTYQLGSLNTYTTMLTNNSSSCSNSSSNGADCDNNMRSRSLSPVSVQEQNSSLTSMEHILSTSTVSSDEMTPYISQQLLSTVVGDYVKSIDMATTTATSPVENNLVYFKMTDISPRPVQSKTSTKDFQYIKRSNLPNMAEDYKIASKNASQEQLLHHTNNNLHENNNSNNENTSAFWGYVAHK